MTVHSHIYLLKNIHLFKYFIYFYNDKNILHIFEIKNKLFVYESICVCICFFIIELENMLIFLLYFKTAIFYFMFFSFSLVFFIYFVCFWLNFCIFFSCIIWKPAGGFHNNWAQHWTENWKSTMIKWISISNNFTQLY